MDFKKINLQIVGFSVLLLIAVVFTFLEGGDEREEKVRLENINAQVNQAVVRGDYKAAAILSAGMKWEYKPTSHKGDVKVWDQKRIALLSEIDNVQGVQHDRNSQTLDQKPSTNSSSINLTEEVKGLVKEHIIDPLKK